MSLFLNKDKTPKSSLLLNCFCLGLVFYGIFGGMYAFLTEPLFRYVNVVSNEFSVVLHAVLMALAGTAVCCIFFALRDKRIVPGAFVFMTISLILGGLVSFNLPVDRRSLMLQLLILYGTGPVLIGNAVSWSVYMRLRRRQRQRALLI